MDTKLTLKLNQESILLAKNYVVEKGISLSKLVENFLTVFLLNQLKYPQLLSIQPWYRSYQELFLSLPILMKSSNTKAT